MSIEKFNPIVSGEIIPYVQVNTHVIQTIKNIEAGFVWVYLLTLPKDWTVVKSHIKTHFGIGEDKIKHIFAYLNRCKLIEYIRTRDSSGKLRKTEIRVLNGSRFDASITTGVKIKHVGNHTCGDATSSHENISKINTTSTGVKTTRVENHTCGKHHTTNNIKNKLYKKNKLNILAKSKIKPTLCPLDFKPNPHHYMLAKQLGTSADDEAPAIIDWSHSKGEKRISWDRAFNNWLRNEVKFNKRGSYAKESGAEIMHRMVKPTIDKIKTQFSDFEHGSDQPFVPQIGSDLWPELDEPT